MNYMIKATFLCFISTALAAEDNVLRPYDVEFEMTALMACDDLTYIWQNEMDGDTAETRISLNDDGTCTFHARRTATFHQLCIFDAEQRVNYATETLRQARADSVQTRSIFEDGQMVMTYTIDDGEEVFRSYVSEALNDGTCETYSTDPASPLYKAPEE